MQMLDRFTLKLIIASSMLYAVFANALAQEVPDLDRRVLNNFSHEMTICAAYYDISAIGLRRAGEEAVAARAEKIAGELIERSSALTKRETVLARYKLAIDDHREAISDDFENFAILNLRYGKFCQVTFENPDERMAEWRRTLSKRR